MPAGERHEFVDKFQAAWSSRDPDRLTSLLHPDVRLVQPLLPELKGREAARRSFANLIALIPDLETAVTGWSASGNRLFIEFRFTGTAGNRKIALDLVDRFELKDGLALYRKSYFNPVPLMRAVAVQPVVLWKFMRSLRG